MELTALTELEAVNAIIGTLGESPINTLEELHNVDAINALRCLRQVSRTEQARGWSFNIIPEYTLNPDINNKIHWNEMYLSIKSTNNEKLIKAGDYIKNLNTNSTIFTAPVVTEVILHVPFEELPEPMRSYIVAKASFVFQNYYFGDGLLTDVISQQVSDAWQHLMDYEMDNNDYSMLNNNSIRELLSR